MELSPATIIVQMVNFLIFFMIILKLFLQPVKKMLDSREMLIKKDIDDAEALKGNAHKLKEEYENRLRDAQAEAQDIVKNAMASGEMMKNDIISQARTEAKRERERAEEEIKVSRENTEKALRSHVADLAVSVAGKVLRETLDQESHTRLMEEFVRKVESQNAV